MGTSVDDLKNKGQKAVNDAADTANGALNTARDMATDLTDSLVSYTKNNPAKALGVAAAAGALLYVLLKSLTTSRD